MDGPCPVQALAVASRVAALLPNVAPMQVRVGWDAPGAVYLYRVCLGAGVLVYVASPQTLRQSRSLDALAATICAHFFEEVA